MGYKYPFERVYHFTFASKSSCAHTLNLVKYPVEFTPSLSIKSPPEELFLIYVSSLFSLTNTSSLKPMDYDLVGGFGLFVPLRIS